MNNPKYRTFWIGMLAVFAGIFFFSWQPLSTPAELDGAVVDRPRPTLDAPPPPPPGVTAYEIDGDGNLRPYQYDTEIIERPNQTDETQTDARSDLSLAADRPEKAETNKTVREAGDSELLSALKTVARVSLVLFCVAFAAEMRLKEASNKRLVWIPFYLAQCTYFALLSFSFFTISAFPPFSIFFGFNFLGLLAFVWLGVSMLSSYEFAGKTTVAPPFMLWYLWALFALSQLLKTGATLGSENATHWLLLSVVFASGFLRARSGLGS